VLFPVIEITAEPADGDPVSSGKVVVARLVRVVAA